MNWEGISEYEWETLGQVRTTPMTDWEKLTNSGRAYDEPIRAAASAAEEEER